MPYAHCRRRAFFFPARSLAAWHALFRQCHGSQAEPRPRCETEARQGFQGNNVARKDDNDALRQARTLPPCAASAVARTGAPAVNMRVKRASPLSLALTEENAKASSDRGGNSPPSQLLSSCHSHFRCCLPRPPAPARSPSHSLCASATSSCLPALPTMPTTACLSVCHPGLPSPWKTSTISFGEQ